MRKKACPKAMKKKLKTYIMVKPPITPMMAVAMAASASFTSPISHPANILVMGPGGYRFVDYIKVGVPLTLVVFVTVMVLLPILWPLTPVSP